MKAVRSRDGTKIVLGNIVGRGGEGEVFGVAGSEDLVVKLYKQDARRGRARKVEAMADLRTEGLEEFVAWPRFAVYSDKRARDFVGFAMRRVPPSSHPIHELYGTSSRLTRFPGRDWRFLLRAAENFATGIAAVHAAGHVVGDINHSNTLVDGQAIVSFIDADSFQVATKGEVFPCQVGVPDFTAPELQGVNLSGIQRSPQHDLFGLGVMVFQLLFLGRHPFSGVFDVGDVPLGDAIRQRLFAYSSRVHGVAPPPGTLNPATAGQDLASLFETCFTTSDTTALPRPLAGRWVDTLKSLQGELVRCGKTATHYHPRHESACPWCEFARRGIEYFPATQPRPKKAKRDRHFQASTLDDKTVQRLWSSITSVRPRPGFDPALTQVSVEVSDLPAAPRTGAGQLADLGQAGLVLLAPIGVLLMCAGALWMGLVLGAVIGGVIVAAEAVDAAMLRRPSVRMRREAATAAHARVVAAAARVDSPQRDLCAKLEQHEQSWTVALAGLERARKEALGLAAWESRELLTAQERLSAGQRDQFMRAQRLRDGDVSGIGWSLVTTLRSFGIETAADVLSAGVGASGSKCRSGGGGAPSCPQCGSRMVQRTAKKGHYRGSRFWGCSTYPRCRGIVNIGRGRSRSYSTASPASGLQRVPGIGPARASDLMSWARGRQATFKPKVNPALLRGEEDRIRGERSNRAAKLLQQLNGGPAELQAINSRFEAGSASTLPVLRESVAELELARAELSRALA